MVGRSAYGGIFGVLNRREVSKLRDFETQFIVSLDSPFGDYGPMYIREAFRDPITNGLDQRDMDEVIERVQTYYDFMTGGGKFQSSQGGPASIIAPHVMTRETDDTPFIRQQMDEAMDEEERAELRELSIGAEINYARVKPWIKFMGQILKKLKDWRYRTYNKELR